MNITGLSDAESALVAALLDQLKGKRERNLLRSLYYDAKRTPADLGILVPPAVFQRLRAVLGWPAKAVDIPAQRVYWQGFSLPEDPGLEAAVAELARLNDLESEFHQATLSALEHSCSFLVADKGEDGEPPAILVTKDALNGTGTWDKRRRALSDFLSVKERDSKGEPSQVALYLPGRTLHLSRSGSQWALAHPEKHALDGIPVEMLAFKPRVGRPFGTSRISRPVLSLTDMAVRTVVRSEIGAEFYSIPQRWLMGADITAFGENADTWRLLIGRIMALGDDDEQKNPRAQVGQFPQASQQPHMEQLRSLAQLFAGETSIPVSSLGISIDSNPTSADSYAASREDIIAEAEGVIRVWRGATARSARNMLAMSGVTYDQRILSRFRDPRYISRSAASDAFMKTATALPWLGESDVAVELLGYDEVTTERLKTEKRRLAGRATLAQLGADVESPAEAGGGGDVTEASELKSRFDALGVAIRAGVDPTDAARRVGLGGAKFTGMVPVNLRDPDAVQP